MLARVSIYRREQEIITIKITISNFAVVSVFYMLKTEHKKVEYATICEIVLKSIYSNADEYLFV